MIKINTENFIAKNPSVCNAERNVSVPFRGSELESSPEYGDTFETEKKKKTAKTVVIAALSTVVLAGGTIFAVCTKKGNEVLKNKGSIWEKFTAGWKEFRGKNKKPPRNNNTNEPEQTQVVNQENPVRKHHERRHYLRRTSFEEFTKEFDELKAICITDKFPPQKIQRFAKLAYEDDPQARKLFAGLTESYDLRYNDATFEDVWVLTEKLKQPEKLLERQRYIIENLPVAEKNVADTTVAELREFAELMNPNDKKTADLFVNYWKNIEGDKHQTLERAYRFVERHNECTADQLIQKMNKMKQISKCKAKDYPKYADEFAEFVYAKDSSRMRLFKEAVNMDAAQELNMEEVYKVLDTIESEMSEVFSPEIVQEFIKAKGLLSLPVEKVQMGDVKQIFKELSEKGDARAKAWMLEFGDIEDGRPLMRAFEKSNEKIQFAQEATEAETIEMLKQMGIDDADPDEIREVSANVTRAFMGDKVNIRGEQSLLDYFIEIAVAMSK